MLGTVEHLHEHIFAVRRPAYSGEVALFVKVIYFQSGHNPALEVAYAELQLFGGGAGHRITYYFRTAGAGTYVVERVFPHGRLILAVNREPASVRGWEYSTIDAELVAAHALAIDYVLSFRFGQDIIGLLALRSGFGELAGRIPIQGNRLRTDFS